MRTSAISVVIALSVVGCSSTPAPTATEGPTSVLQTGAFKHETHLPLELDGKTIACINCHAVDTGAKFATKRPGLEAHAPCDGCHRQAFFSPPGELCLSCHVSVDAFNDGKSPLNLFPRQQGRAQLISVFDHKAHLRRNTDRIKEGGQFVCEACHQVKDIDAAYATFPGHETCSDCHGAVAAPKMNDCNGCHATDGPTKGRKFIDNDIRFTHGKHRADASGQRIDCLTCHYSIPNNTESSSIVLPLMKDCAQCHENPARTPDRVRISNCGICHVNDVNSAPLPGNHTAMIDLEEGKFWSWTIAEERSTH